MNHAPPSARAPVLVARQLAKRFGELEALRGLDLTVQQGEVVGLLGRNGAGKSTALRIMMGIHRPTSGELRLFGEPLVFGDPRPRRMIGYVAQEQHFYGWMTPVALGEFVSGFFPTWDHAEYQRLLRGLDVPAGRKVRTFSGGMVAKLALCLALAHRPPLLILDEPTAGMDPVARREFIDIVQSQARASGCTTLFSSHLIDEVEAAASTVVIVDAGRTLYEGSVEALRHGFCRLRGPEAAVLPEALQGQVVADRVRDGQREVVVRGNIPMPPSPWSRQSMRLEDIFVAMVSGSVPW